MSEKNQEDSKTIENLNKKVDDIQCVIQIIIVLIILIFLIEISQILDGTFTIWLIIIAIFFVIVAAICIRCTGDNHKLLEHSEQT